MTGCPGSRAARRSSTSDARPRWVLSADRWNSSLTVASGPAMDRRPVTWQGSVREWIGRRAARWPARPADRGHRFRGRGAAAPGPGRGAGPAALGPGAAQGVHHGCRPHRQAAREADLRRDRRGRGRRRGADGGPGRGGRGRPGRPAGAADRPRRRRALRGRRVVRPAGRRGVHQQRHRHPRPARADRRGAGRVEARHPLRPHLHGVRRGPAPRHHSRGARRARCRPRDRARVGAGPAPVGRVPLPQRAGPRAGSARRRRRSTAAPACSRPRAPPRPPGASG